MIAQFLFALFDQFARAAEKAEYFQHILFVCIFWYSHFKIYAFPIRHAVMDTFRRLRAK